MKPIQLILFGAALGVLLTSPFAGAQTTVPATGPATTRSATSTTAPATTTTAATTKASDEECKPSIPQQAIKTVRDSSVIVSVTFKKDTSEDASDEDRTVEERYFQYLRDRKMTLDFPGLVLAEGQIIIPDLQLNNRFIQSIEVRTLAGQVMQAKLTDLLSRCEGAILKVQGEDARKLTPLKFTPLDKIDLTTTLQELTLHRQEDQWWLMQSDLNPSLVLADKQQTLVYGTPGQASSRYHRGYWEGPSIIANAKGEPVGIACGAGIDSREAYGLWLGKSLLECPRIDVARLEADKKAMRDRLLKSVHEVVIQFRQGRGGESESPSYDSRRGGSFNPDSIAGREVTLYGVAINDTQILIPLQLDRRVAAQIDRIEVKYSLLQRVPAKFVGAYKEFGAFLIELPKGKLPAVAEMTDSLPQRGEPFWGGSPRKKFAGKYIDLDYNRLLSRERGYANQYHWTANRQPKLGELLYDYQGRLFGLSMKQRMEDEEQKEVLGQAGRGFADGQDQFRIFTLGEIRSQLSAAAEHFDDQVAVKTRLAARRRPWFGVEYVTLSAEVAEHMKVSKPTKDGTVGLLVNAVYEDSPAAKAGIEVGDILLSLTVAGKDEPVEFKGQNAHEDSYGYDEGGDDGGSVSGEEGPPEATWKSRNNFLTNLLDAISVGKKVTIRYYHPADAGAGQEKTVTFSIELAPPDFDSSRRWKNEKLGLTVKDLTYEIRKALTLPADAPGVVVAKIETGRPAAEARIWPNEIVTHADGKPVISAWQLQQTFAAAKAAGKDKVRLTVLRLGKSRFADIKVESYSAKDDEGLDEEDDTATTRPTGAKTPLPRGRAAASEPSTRPTGP